MRAVVLAGGLASPGLIQAAGERYKGLIRLGGRPAVSYVLDALAKASLVEKTVLVGPRDMEPLAGSALFATEGNSVSENLLIGIDALQIEGSRESVLVVTSDIPLLRPEDVRRFVELLPSEIGAAASFVRRERAEKEQPGAPYHYIRMPEGEFATGNLAALTPHLAYELAPQLQGVYRSRKSQLRVALKLGLITMIKFRFGKLRVSEAIKAVEGLVGQPVYADLDASPRTSLDLDAPEDYRYLLDHWTNLRSDP